ncbi:MAG TPA: SGNH/GDSL hydrolase family protein [Solirubrobacteraceae bacterium]|nr:SGNH/GDSL hydrolase family protein [Solirubrobacteraceae bacterium]
MAFVCALLALGGGSALAKSKAKQKPKPVPPAKNLPVVPGSQYLALGDSVTFGYMEPTVVPAPTYGNAASFPGYPEQLGARLRLSVANPACPGETAASLVNASAPSNGCENSPSHNSADDYRNNPLHVNYKGSQLAFALSYLHSHHNVRLVTLMIGANDFFLCQETTSDSCGSTAEQDATAAAVTKNIHTILSAIRNKAHYNGQLVMVNYYSLNYSVPAINAQSQLLNKVQDAAAKPFGVKIADGYGELQAASVHSGGDSCTAGLLTQLSAGGCGIHPSYAGQALLAQALEKTITIG